MFTAGNRLQSRNGGFLGLLDAQGREWLELVWNAFPQGETGQGNDRRNGVSRSTDSSQWSAGVIRATIRAESWFLLPAYGDFAGPERPANRGGMTVLSATHVDPSAPGRPARETETRMSTVSRPGEIVQGTTRCGAADSDGEQRARPGRRQRAATPPTMARVRTCAGPSSSAAPRPGRPFGRGSGERGARHRGD
jgi:hypothetical protein